VRVALCQVDPTVGDFAGNRARIEAAVTEARHRGAEWALFSELVISGYPPEDLLFHSGLRKRTQQALAEIREEIGAGASCPDKSVIISRIKQLLLNRLNLDFH